LSYIPNDDVSYTARIDYAAHGAISSG